MEKIKFGLIGCGRIGLRHAVEIKKVGVLQAICDINKERLSLAKKECELSTAYDNIDELLDKEKDIDVISICTPNGLHAEHSIKSLKKGFHVLCEKPMAIKVEDCGKMINEAEHANKRLFIVKQNRFNPPIVALKQVIAENRLGRIFSVQLNCFWNRNNNYYQSSDWKGTKKLDGGTLFTQFSHFIDLLYWLIGDIRNVYPIIKNYAHENIIEFEDAGVVTLEFYNGVIGTINYNVNSYQKNFEGSITIFAEKGTVKVGGPYLNKLDYQCIDNYVIEDLPEGKGANEYGGQYQGSMSNHDEVYKNVVDVLNNKGVIATNGYEGLKTVEIIDKIYAKSRYLIDSSRILGL
ncbi:MAG: oxidoreductase [Bacteroidetes bacterium GWE2_29_8]|nr:MAG: oxidoreductase [Bacteroidetes bacterium GWE2_29_8]OFY14231.1 MAG: oxidoreductase [Bacteroidetes bacterium GWF2_29_10]